MPGLHVIASLSSTNESITETFNVALRKMKHFQWYSTDVLYNDQRIIIGRSFYDGYPLAFFSRGSCVTLVEGAIYNLTRQEIGSKLEEISLDDSSIPQLSRKIRKVLDAAEGEFVVLKYDKKTGMCLIFNDALGRLPFYYCSLENRSLDSVVLSREVGFIMPLLEEDLQTDFDKTAIAEYLLLGYPLGNKTIWKSVKRLFPASLLIINTKCGDFSLERVFEWKLDPQCRESDTRKDTHENAKELARLFTDALRNISERFSKDYSHIVSLSGGLDSRATLAGLLGAGANPTTYSFPSGENNLARKTANTMGVSHDIISLSSRMRDNDFFKIFGLMDLSMRSREVSYLEGIKKRTHGKAIFYTGDGGDKTIGPLGPESGISNVGKLARYLLEADSIFSTDEVSSILNIPSKGISEQLEKHLMSYPEITIEGKLAHFKVFERGHNWLFVGEDRSRFFMWSTTPFYSLPFFKASMAIPQRAKRHYLLYKYFLANLKPALLRIRYYDRFIPLSIPDWALKLYFTFFDLLKRNLYKSGNASLIDLVLSRSTRPSQEEMDQLKEPTLHQLGRGGPYAFLDTSKASQLIKMETNKKELSVLATLILCVGSKGFLDSA